MSQSPHPDSQAPLALEEHAGDLCRQFETAWTQAMSGGEEPRLEVYLGQCDEEELRAELVRIDQTYRRGRGQAETLDATRWGATS